MICVRGGGSGPFGGGGGIMVQFGSYWRSIIVGIEQSLCNYSWCDDGDVSMLSWPVIELLLRCC